MANSTIHVVYCKQFLEGIWHKLEQLFLLKRTHL